MGGMGEGTDVFDVEIGLAADAAADHSNGNGLKHKCMSFE
jgi:hypothetical protein